MRSLRRAILALIGLALFVAALTGAFVLFEKQLIYFPLRGLDLTPAELGLRHEELRLVAEDGVRLHGWLLPAATSRFSVVVCHGNAGNVSHRLERAALMQQRLGVDVLLFDYRGYGLSEGAPDEEGTYRDARAAYRHLVAERGLAPERIVLFGESLGAAVAVQLALEQPAHRALVLEAPFTSVADMARALYPLLPLGRFVRTRYDSLSKVPRLGRPLLVLHGDRDEIVPFAQGRRLFEAAVSPKRFFTIRGAGHNDTYVTGGEDYWRAWREFLDAT